MFFVLFCFVKLEVLNLECKLIAKNEMSLVHIGVLIVNNGYIYNTS